MPRRPRRPAPHTQPMFAAPAPRLAHDYVVARIDGGARGNPGPAGYGVLLEDRAGRKLAELSHYLGPRTNNFAEYSGLIAALEYAAANPPKAVKVLSDSELLVKQMRGEYKVKSPDLRPLYEKAKTLSHRLEWFAIEHVARRENREADRLANQAMDQGMGRPSAAPPDKDDKRELRGVVRDGVVELLDGSLPEGTRVRVRVPPS
ncbi:MAG TPA: ribonuclease HI family protein [Terriglobales bacterium]|nr:ribonuclease HI family protein [Terriglobales bacterium]